jgi:superoxide dismutase, Fe-Mn family
MHTLISLPFAVTDLSPVINQQTVEIHHGKHHATYVTNLNKLLETLPELEKLNLENLLLNLAKVPESSRIAVTNNAGQVYNHNQYWESINKPNSTTLKGDLKSAIEAEFGSIEEFQIKFSEAGMTQFGSGWAWLSIDSNGKLVISKTANADSPLLHGLKPILTMDVWEHAYYLDFQNRRADYIKDFFSLINWDSVSTKFAAAK